MAAARAPTTWASTCSAWSPGSTGWPPNGSGCPCPGPRPGCCRRSTTAARPASLRSGRAGQLLAADDDHTGPPPRRRRTGHPHRRSWRRPCRAHRAITDEGRRTLARVRAPTAQPSSTRRSTSSTPPTGKCSARAARRHAPPPGERLEHLEVTRAMWRQPKAVWAVALPPVVAFMGIGLVDPILDRSPTTWAPRRRRCRCCSPLTWR